MMQHACQLVSLSTGGTGDQQTDTAGCPLTDAGVLQLLRLWYRTRKAQLLSATRTARVLYTATPFTRAQEWRGARMGAQ